MKTTALEIDGTTVTWAFPSAIAVGSLVEATEHLPASRSIRSIWTDAGFLLTIAQEEIRKAPPEVTALQIVLPSGDGAAVARDFDAAALCIDAAVVCIDGVAFQVSSRVIHGSNGRAADAHEQAAKNRRAELRAEIERLGMRRKSRRRDEQLRILNEILTRAA